MSSRTSSRSTLTIVPSTMSPSLKYLMVLSMAARKSSLEPMSLTATWGEVTEGLGIWGVAPDRFGRRDSCYFAYGACAELCVFAPAITHTGTSRAYSTGHMLDKPGLPSWQIMINEAPSAQPAS